MHPLLLLSLTCVLLYILQSLPWLITLALIFFVGYVALSSLVDAPPMSTRRKLMFGTWSPPSEGTIFGVLDCDATKLVPFIEKHAKEGHPVTITGVVIKACAMAFREAPNLNGRFAFGKFIPHKSIDVSCLVAIEGGKDLASVKIQNADKSSLFDIGSLLRRKAQALRDKKDADFNKTNEALKMMPTWLVGTLAHFTGYLAGVLGLSIPALGVKPFPFGSVMVTSVGMMGVEQAFVPFTPFAHVPVLFMVGAIKDRVVPENGVPVIKPYLNLTGSVDHRFVDGADIARFGKRMRELLENPELIINDVTSSSTTGPK